MTASEQIEATDLPAVLRSVLDALTASRREIDNLNVFPVPDGDTGTNLVATVRSAVDAADEAASDGADGPAVAAAAARGALRGAAGNSGVIFSQVLRAVAEHLADRPLDTAAVAGVLARARDLSYEAVAEPLPGTILTAMDAAADHAAGLDTTVGLADVLRQVLVGVAAAVANSRDVLDANRAAGVVDAGARGFEVALDGVLAYLEGRTFESVEPPAIRRIAGDVVTRESGSGAFAYEVQYLLEAPDDVAGGLRDRLERLGDSVVVVACGGLVNVHVHTNEVDEAVAVGREIGGVSRLQVTRFEDQIAEFAEFAASARRGEGEEVSTAVGYLAVLPGTGLVELARGMGARAVNATVGALPTVATILNAVGTVQADEVVLLPGHPNVVPTMQQASAVSVAEGGRALHVVDAADSVPAVLGLLAVAPTDELDLDWLTAAAEGVRAGEVVAAVRDAETPAGPVSRGQWLAVAAGDVVSAHHDAVEAVTAVVSAIVTPDHELVTLVAGAEVEPGEQVRVTDQVAELAPHVEVEVVRGGQRPARWLVGAE